MAKTTAPPKAKKRRALYPGRQALMIELWRRPGGATAAELAEKTGSPPAVVASALRPLVRDGVVVTSGPVRGTLYQAAGNPAAS